MSASDSTRIYMQLFMPPAMALLLFWMGRNTLNSANPYGIMSESRRKMLWAVVFAVLVFLYGVTFNRELRAHPIVAVGLFLLVVVFVIWRLSKWRLSESTKVR